MACIPIILTFEGGYVNHPDDPGGETKYGIAKRYHPTLDIKNLTLDEAKEIYYRDYWLASHAHKIPDLKLALIYFDTAVNCGVATAMRLLKRLPLNAFYYQGSGLWQDYLHEREIYYQHIVQANSAEAVFLHGWENRLQKLQEINITENDASKGD